MAGPVQKIRFHYLVKDFHLKDRTLLKRFIWQLCRKEGRAVEAINYIFCTDDYLLKINKEYLNHDTYTDIVTFELSSKDQPILSDIYISIDRVRANAKSFQSAFKTELHRVIFHGALHLCGYKDKKKEQSILMRSMEDAYLKKYFRSTWNP